MTRYFSELNRFDSVVARQHAHLTRSRLRMCKRVQGCLLKDDAGVNPDYCCFGGLRLCATGAYGSLFLNHGTV